MQHRGQLDLTASAKVKACTIVRSKQRPEKDHILANNYIPSLELVEFLLPFIFLLFKVSVIFLHRKAQVPPATFAKTLTSSVRKWPRTQLHTLHFL